MSEQFYHNLYIVFGIIAAILLVVALVLYIVLNIYEVFMDLTGIRRKRALRKMDEDTDFTTRLNRRKHAREKIMTKTGQINTDQKASEPPVPPFMPTAVSKEETQTTVLEESTQVLNAENETQLLSNQSTESETQFLSNQTAESETQLLNASSQIEKTDETQLLSNYMDDGETQLLKEEFISPVTKEQQKSNHKFVVERNIIYIHTEEVI